MTGRPEGSDPCLDGRPRLSVVVPAHDEAAGIAWAVEALCSGVAEAQALGHLGPSEVVVVDDHSTDATVDRVASTVAPPGVAIRTVPVVGPQGLGSAVRTGLAAATGDLVLYTDADLPFDPGELPRLLRPLERYQADLVCGYRLDRTSEGVRRALQSHAYNGLARAALPITVRDVNFACKLLRRSVVDAVLGDLASTGSFIDAELLARCAHHDFHVIQVGVDYFPRHGSASTLGGAAAIAGILRDLASMHRELRRPRRRRPEEPGAAAGDR